LGGVGTVASRIAMGLSGVGKDGGRECCEGGKQSKARDERREEKGVNE